MIHHLMPILAEEEPMFWMPQKASTLADKVDPVFELIFWISFVFFALIIGLMVYFVIRYRRRHVGQAAEEGAPDHSTPLELICVGMRSGQSTVATR